MLDVRGGAPSLLGSRASVGPPPRPPQVWCSMLSVMALVPAWEPALLGFGVQGVHGRGKPLCKPPRTGGPGQGSARSEQFPIAWCICFAYIKTFVLPSRLPIRVLCAALCAPASRFLTSAHLPRFSSLSSPLFCPPSSCCFPPGGGEALPEEGEVRSHVWE